MNMTTYKSNSVKRNTNKILIFLKKIPSNVLLYFMAALIILPIGWMFLSSFRPPDQITIYPPQFWPRKWTLDNYKVCFAAVPIFKYITNTIIFATATTAAAVMINAMAGYGFARTNFKGKNVIFTILMCSMMIPFQVIMLPLFMEMYWFGMIDKYIGLVLPRVAIVISIFFMRSYFATLPKELEEAGRIDGLKEIGIYFRIMLPLCGPAIITQVVLTFNMCWNDLLWPLLIMNSPDKRMLSTGIANMISQDSIEYGPAFAAGVLSVLPLFILFLVGQKYFVNSITAGAIKG